MPDNKLGSENSDMITPSLPDTPSSRSFQSSEIEVSHQVTEIPHVIKIMHGAIQVASGVNYQGLVPFLWSKK